MTTAAAPLRAALPPRRLSLATRFTAWAREHRLGALLLIAPVLLFLLFMLALPLASVVEMSFFKRGPAGSIVRDASLINYTTFLHEHAYFKILLNSAAVGARVCVFTVALAFVPAAALGLTRSRFKNILFLLILVPFWTSFIVRTYAWIVMLGTNGVVNGALKGAGLIDAPLSLLYSRETIVLGLVHAMLPFAIVPIYASIERIDESILEAAATLGARPWHLFAEIVIPISLPGVIAAAILVFIEAMGAFITPQLLGSANDMMIAQLVQERFLASFDWPFGSAVAVIYLIFTGAAFAVLIAGRNLIARTVR
jgi:spermidine/putrescine transport system permease protein